MEQLRKFGFILQIVMQQFAMMVIILGALGLLVSTGMAAAGLWPWIHLPVSLDGTPVEGAGMLAQIALTALVLGLLFYLPTNGRVMRLENSHRQFGIRMEDVARAYWEAHAADRKGLFHAASEFDAVKERLNHLRDHPDLGRLEPEILEVAAQMSQVSRDLAETYADDKVERARIFLAQRQEEVERFEGLLDQARAVHGELKHWLTRVETDEAVAQSQLSRLREEIEEIMPEITSESAPATVQRNGREVVHLSSLAAE